MLAKPSRTKIYLRDLWSLLATPSFARTIKTRGTRACCLVGLGFPFLFRDCENSHSWSYARGSLSWHWRGLTTQSADQLRRDPLPLGMKNRWIHLIPGYRDRTFAPLDSNDLSCANVTSNGQSCLMYACTQHSAEDSALSCTH